MANPSAPRRNPPSRTTTYGTAVREHKRSQDARCDRERCGNSSQGRTKTRGKPGDRQHEKSSRYGARRHVPLGPVRTPHICEWCTTADEQPCHRRRRRRAPIRSPARPVDKAIAHPLERDILAKATTNAASAVRPRSATHAAWAANLAPCSASAINRIGPATRGRATSIPDRFGPHRRPASEAPTTSSTRAKSRVT
jgi:hypothetical protein